jgi:ABC-type sugar transport system substrate-binding protein
MDAAAGALIRAWLVKKHQAMLADFLNALEIKNENGVVDDLPASVDDAKLKLAVESLLAKYPHEVVAVYLNAFNDMNAAGWANLKALLETDARLQLGNHA